jgi:hypothetical protein
MSYCTAADVRLVLGLDSTSEDTLLTTEYIPAAQAIIDAYCGGRPPRVRTFEASGDTTRKFHALSHVIGTVLHLQSELAQAPTTVTHNNGATTVIQTTNYILLNASDEQQAPYNKLQLIDGTTWTYNTALTPVNAISITGRFAYSVTVPNDIKLACIELVADRYRQKDTVQNMGLVTGGDGATMLPDAMPKRVLSLLDPYVWG